MTVQRQYTLPNCNLKLEGLSGGDDTDPMAPLAVVLNTECSFPGLAETLNGGREFLDALVKAVSDYTQTLLSGVTYPLLHEPPEAHLVTLQPGANHRHQLMATTTSQTGEAVCKTLDLNAVQLFDLMEAVDQLLADTQTLPDMTLQLSPLHRRYARPDEPVAQRVVPIAAGLSALAASAAIFFVLPVPEVEPDRPREDQNAAAVVEDAASADPDTETPPTAEATPAAGTGEPDPEIDPETTADAVAAATALTRLSTAPAITDPATLAELEAQLETQLEAELADPIPFEESLVYRVAVSESGDLLGYKYENDAALLNVDNTPLPDLTFTSLPDESLAEPVAQFRLTLDPDGDVTAEPIASDAAE